MSHSLEEIQQFLNFLMGNPDVLKLYDLQRTYTTLEGAELESNSGGLVAFREETKVNRIDIDLRLKSLESQIANINLSLSRLVGVMKSNSQTIAHSASECDTRLEEILRNDPHLSRFTYY